MSRIIKQELGEKAAEGAGLATPNAEGPAAGFATTAPDKDGEASDSRSSMGPCLRQKEETKSREAERKGKAAERDG